MREYIDLSNKQAGWLKVLELTDLLANNGTTKLWKCRCKCGNIVYKTANKLNDAIKNKYNLSCGCSKSKKSLKGQIFNDFIVLDFIKDLSNCNVLWKCKCLKCNNTFELSTKRLKKNKNICKVELKKQIEIEHCLHNCLSRMKTRCYNKKSREYKYYGAKGVVICKEWLEDSDKFVKWALENGYKNEKNDKGYNILTIDRIDSEGNYEPSNCRWVDMYVQANNKNINSFFNYNGETKTLAQWCRELNINYKYTHYLIRYKKMPFEEAIKYRKRG